MTFVKNLHTDPISPVNYFRGSETNGWQCNGVNGVTSYAVTSSLTNGTGSSTIYYTDSDGDSQSSTVTYATQSASMTQMEVRLQTNTARETGKPISCVFVLKKTTVVGTTRTSEFVATLKLTISTGLMSNSCTILSSPTKDNNGDFQLPSDVTLQSGVVSMLSPIPVTGKTINYSLLPVEFKTYPDTEAGPDKARKLNLATRQNEKQHYNGWEKCVCKVWTSSKVDLIDYLTPGDRELFEQNLWWFANESDLPGHELDLGDEPDTDEQKEFSIQVCPKGSSVVIDKLTITVVPRSTKEKFDAWHTAESADMGWLAYAPAMYQSLGYGNSDPEPPTVLPGLNGNWFSPGAINTYYHPDGFYEMRSLFFTRPVLSSGHQACYDAQGAIITTGISGCSADKELPVTSGGSFTGHLNSDVKPFIWALQLDGNPVQGTFTYTNLTAPIMHEGAYARKYLVVRPAVPNQKPMLAPGTSP